VPAQACHGGDLCPTDAVILADSVDTELTVRIRSVTV
jgi:hypothetical protein